MIRINLLGQPRPKARRRPGPLEGSLQMVLLLFALVLAGGALVIHYGMIRSDLSAQQKKISELQVERTRLQQIKADVEQRERQKAALKQRVAVIEELQRNRTGGQELLEQVANTVNRVDALWMTSLTRKGNELTMEGSADSIAAVANLITQLKRSGYFGKVEIKESKQDDRKTSVTIFLFTLTADFTLPTAKPAAGSSGKS
jgi:type IV pilus assembly protein PilN